MNYIVGAMENFSVKLVKRGKFWQELRSKESSSGEYSIVITFFFRAMMQLNQILENAKEAINKQNNR